MKEIVNLSNIYKSFGAVQALVDFNLSINEGEIVGLMGDNGAGKSTLLKILAGNFLPTSGKINFSGNDVTFNNPNDAIVDLIVLEDGISPGQACVFYNKDSLGYKVLGGGWING